MCRPRKERKTLFYFNGNLGSAYEHGRPENTCASTFALKTIVTFHISLISDVPCSFVQNYFRYSMGIRQKLAEEFGSTPNKEGKFGRQHSANVIVSPLRSPKYLEELASSLFCGVLPGDGWSGRMEDSILQGCIPVIIQVQILLLLLRCLLWLVRKMKLILVGYLFYIFTDP